MPSVVTSSPVSPPTAAAADEFVVTPAGDEADFLAVFFLGDTQTDFGRHATDLRLFKTADWQHHSRQQLAPNSEQHVRLILAGVDAAQQRGRPSDVVVNRA